MNNIKNFIDFVNESTINEKEMCDFSYYDMLLSQGISDKTLGAVDKAMAPALKYLGVKTIKDMCNDGWSDGEGVQYPWDEVADNWKQIIGKKELAPIAKLLGDPGYTAGWAGKYKGKKVMIFDDGGTLGMGGGSSWSYVANK